MNPPKPPANCCGKPSVTNFRSDVDVGILLSGGIDSSAVAALAAPLAGRKLHSFSIGFQEASYNELPFAEEVARKVGTEHHHQTLTPKDVVGALPAIYRGLDEPLGDASLVPTWFLARLASGKVKTVLGGDGGDELFAGYPSFKPTSWSSAFLSSPSASGSPSTI